jgi:hypothetical protein
MTVNIIYILDFIFSVLITNFSYFLLGKTFINKSKYIDKSNIFEQLICGFIIISFISVIINFFFPLNKLLNTIFLLTTFFIFLFNKEKITKTEILLLIITSLFTCMFIALDTINRPDGMIYHYPFSKILNEEKIIIGISNLHFRFTHTSILQYSSSINRNYLSGDIGLVVPLASIYISILLYILNELCHLLKNKKFSLSKIFLIFITFYITYKINRYGKIGNDDIGHLISFLIIYKFLDYKNFSISNVKYLCLLSVFVISNKFSLIIFCLFPLVILFNNRKFLNKIIFSLPTFFLIIWLVKNFLISGCFLYPVDQTCIKNISWTNTKVIKEQKVSGEAWAKDWPNYIGEKSTMENYIKNFNWLNTWSKNHLKIFLKNIIPLFLFSVIIILYNKKNNLTSKLTSTFHNKFFYAFLILLFGTIIFFLKFPLYRYGYSYLVSLVALTSAIFVNDKNKIKMLNITKYMIVFLLIILPTKQFLRYYKYFNERPIVPEFTDKNLKLEKKILGKNFNYFLNNKSQYCWYNKALCTYYEIENIKVEKFKSYKILNLKEK